MTAPPAVRLPPVLASVIERLGQTSSWMCEQCVQSLSMSALALAPGYRREQVEDAHQTLLRGRTAFQAEFLRSLSERIRREWGSLNAVAADGPSGWDTWGLVGDREIEQQVAEQRFGRSVGQGCEWELRELEGYLRAMTPADRAAPARGTRASVLRPETIGHAVISALDAIAASDEVRRLLTAELVTTWSAHLPKTYALIIGDFRAAGITPTSVAVLNVSRSAPVARPSPGSSGTASPAGAAPATCGPAGHAFGPSQRGLAGSSGGPPVGGAADHPRGAQEAAAHAGLTVLLRELTRAADRPGVGHPAVSAAQPTDTAPDGRRQPAMSNLIHAHREQLVRAATGPMDDRVIDAVGALFEQILSDPNVPAVVGQQIGRLQLPVLRAALTDPDFFASRRHPVRLLINRLASLSLSLDDLESAACDDLVRRIRELVSDIVHGDFEQLPLYDGKLAELEQFVAESGRREIEQQGATPQLLADRESELHAQQRAAHRLRSSLQSLPAPGFVREFIAEVWSRVLVRRVRIHGVDGAPAAQARQVARDLFMSIQPKGTPEQRKAFVAALPRLMQDLSAGLDEVGWSAASRHEFFGQLLPAHAQSLRGEGLRTLDYNLMARQVEQALAAAAEHGRDSDAHLATGAIPLESGLVPLLSSAEARSVGLLEEEQVDWSESVAEPATGTHGTVAPGDPAIAGPEPAEPTQGRALAEHVQLGFVYRMHLEGGWHKVRLMHVSPGRAFFVFARGKRHRRIVSLTQRMLLRMCESGRLRALESAYLIERAQARARQQLERLSPVPDARD